jgi:hypothetical protein
VKWKFDMTMKYEAEQESCALASRAKTEQSRAKLLEECTRLRGEHQ